MSNVTKPTTIAELRSSGYHERSVKTELRENLIRRLRNGEKLFPQIVGYEDSVIPQIINAILAEQNFILLGLRGQAKSRILRALTDLLDSEIPVIAGSEINDSPFHPISAFGRETVRTLGDNTPIRWLSKEHRYVEKLATPDVTIADLIGDLDPIKAAQSGKLLSDELTIHYGLLPRANRGIFAVNELPDLAGKIQVGLFNILQEGDIQIKGYPVRLPLDVMLVFSANPEDYTARGKIITPLKDRIGAEIRTHYPKELSQGIAITAQEAHLDRTWPGGDKPELGLSPIVGEVIEMISFLAREDRRIDKRSGVSQRLPISLMESVVSNAERRAILLNEKRITPRLSDLYASLPAIVGKIELEYEGESLGAERIAQDLIRRSSAAIFSTRLKEIEVKGIVDTFNSGKSLSIPELSTNSEVVTLLRKIPGLFEAGSCAGLDTEEGIITACELILESLYAQKRLTRSEATDSSTYIKAPREVRTQTIDERFN